MLCEIFLHFENCWCILRQRSIYNISGLKQICRFDIEERIPKLNYIHLQVFLDHCVHTLAFFHVKHVLVFVLVNHYYM